jgi:hypothetical protein
VWRNETNSVPSEGILVARITGNHVKSDTSNEKVRSMDSLRASLAAVPGNENGAIFAYSSAWLNYEQYKAIEQEAIRNISSTMAVMVVIIAFLLVNPKAVSVTCFCLCLIIVNIIGYMHFWGLALDSVTIIMLVIALGLSVDYAAHIGRAFMETHGTPDERLTVPGEHGRRRAKRRDIHVPRRVTAKRLALVRVHHVFPPAVSVHPVWIDARVDFTTSADVHRQPQAVRARGVRTRMNGTLRAV